MKKRLDEIKTKIRKGLAVISTAAATAAVSVAAQASDPFSQTLTTKVIPWLQGVSTTIAILAAIYAGYLKMFPGKNDAEISQKANKIFIGIAVGLLVVWGAPAMITWFVGLVS